MRGFLTRAGHLLGRLAVSLGYGGAHSLYDDPHPRIAVCLRAEIAAAMLETHPGAIVLTAAPMAAPCLLTEIDAIDVATEPRGARIIATEIEEC